MRGNDRGSIGFPGTPVESLLAHERTIVPQLALVRARVLARAREALRMGDAAVLASTFAATVGHRLLFAFTGAALLASAAAMHLSWSQSSGSRAAASSPQATRDTGAVPPPSIGTEEDGPAELRLLERAHALHARGDLAAVLAITGEHERRYPAGHLCEEREVLRLQALIGLGRRNEASQAAARFRRDYPRSVLLPKLDEMLASAP